MSRRLWFFAQGGLIGAAVGVTTIRLILAGHLVWALVFLAAVVVATWAWAAWSLSDGHLYAVYARRRRREQRKARG